jgi:hypothetical protein
VTLKPDIDATQIVLCAHQIQSSLRQAQSHVEHLAQSLLAKVFRGERVPAKETSKGCDYEPASVAGTVPGEIPKGSQIKVEAFLEKLNPKGRDGEVS